MISRRGFFGLVSAAVVAPFVPAPPVFVPLRRATGGVDFMIVDGGAYTSGELLVLAQRRYNAAMSAMLDMRYTYDADLAFAQGSQWKR